MDSLTRRLLTEQNECTFGWLASDGRPVSTVVSFVWLDEAVWMTAQTSSARARALGRDPRASVTVSGKGSPVGHSRCVSLQGRCEVHTDADTRDRFFPAFGRVVLAANPRGAEQMSAAMNTPSNAVLILRPERMIPYDSHDAMERANRASS